MAWACNRHSSQYYCDECSPPSEREKDEASDRVWWNHRNPPQKQVLTESGPVDIPSQSNFVNVVEDDDYLSKFCLDEAPNLIRRCTLPKDHAEDYHEYSRDLGVIHRWRDGKMIYKEAESPQTIDGVEQVQRIASRTNCDHYFQDTNHCIKCGWRPEL